jgi:hypothetical protein
MKLFCLILALLIDSLAAQAKQMSDCHHSCFEHKYQCNINKSHTYNTCNDDLLRCRVSCQNGTKRNSYASTLPIDVSFYPTLKLD